MGKKGGSRTTPRSSFLENLGNRSSYTDFGKTMGQRVTAYKDPDGARQLSRMTTRNIKTVGQAREVSKFKTRFPNTIDGDEKFFQYSRKRNLKKLKEEFKF